MGRQEHVAHAHQRVVLRRGLFFVDIDGRTGDRPVAQGLDQVGFRHHVAARGIDEKGRLLHEGEELLADDALVGGAARDVQGQEISGAENLFHRRGGGGEFGHLLGREKRIVADDLHVETARGLQRYPAADLAQPDDAEHFPGQVRAEQLVADGEIAGPGLPVQLDEVARQGEDAADGVLGDRVGVGFRRKGHPYAQFGRLGHIDIVVAHPVARDDLELLAGLEHLGREKRRARQDGVAVDHVGRNGLRRDAAAHLDLVPPLAQVVFARLGHILRDQHFISHFRTSF